MQGTGTIQETATPARIGKYEVVEEIGNGTLVKVFRAIDRDTGRSVTLKLLATGEDRRVVELFRRKVAAAAKLRHKNLIAIYELGDHGGLPFAAMQNLDGGDLRRTIDAPTSLSLLRKWTILCQVAEGLRAAHQGGLGSVGLCPSGVAFTEDGSAVIQDFSIVRLIGDREDVDGAYASPEELEDGVTPDPLCDIFAFGEICHEFLSARGEPIAPEAGIRLVYRARERNREARYQSMDEMLEDAQPILSGLQRSRAAELLAEARRQQSAGELERAQEVLRELLELDAGNRHGRRMHSAIRDELHRRALKARLEELFAEAEREAQQRRFARAVELLDSARELDGSNPEVHARLDEMCARLERSQHAAQLIADGRQLLVEQKLGEAEAKAVEAQAVDPEVPEAAELLQAIGQSMQRRLAEANALLAEQSFDAAISLVQELRKQRRDSALLDLWLERTMAQKAEAERQVRLQKQLGEVRALMAQDDLQQALIKLAMLADEFPRDKTVAELLEQTEQAMRRAALVREVLAEVEWLLGQDRPDLAAQFLREKCRELSDEERLQGRLADIERMLPEWENRRFVEDCLARAAGLEEQHQWAVALALLEQALEACPDSAELRETAARLRKARRLETIQHTIDAEAWAQAIQLLEAGQKEFAGDPELDRLLEQARDGRRRSECEKLGAAVRQCLADDEIERAEEMLAKGREWLGEEHELDRELASRKQQREAWRTAQALFGRRQYREAEELLTALAAQNREDVKALLETIRAARAASEENDFYKRGREQALHLIEQKQLEQAADLLRNLLNLFPNDPILERDLQQAQPSVPAPLIPAPAPEATPPAPVPELALTIASPAPSRVLWITVAGLLLLVSASAGVWTLSHKAPAASPVQPRAAAPAVEPSPAPEPPHPSAAEKPRAVKKTTGKAPESFHPPLSVPSTPVAAAAPAALPPGPDGIQPGIKAPSLPSQAVDAVAPRPEDKPAPAPPPPPSAPPAPPIRTGGKVQEPKALRTPAPVVPPLALQRGIYGVVKLEATVSEKGNVTQVRVLSGDPILASAAKDAVRTWRYQPGALNGRPIEMNVQVQVQFESRR